MKTVRFSKSGKRVPLSKELRNIVLDLLTGKFGCVCWYCGINLGSKEIHIDHIDPLSKGGADTIHNLALSCVSCNRAKWDLSFAEFVRWVNRLRRMETFPAKDGFNAMIAYVDNEKR